MPTKIPAYMFSGTPTLAYGPDSVASIDYARDWAYCVTKRDKKALCDAIKLLADYEQMRTKLAHTAQKLATMRHDRAKVAAEFQGVIIETAKA